MNAEEFVNALHEYAQLTLPQVKEAAQNENLPVRSVIMANWLVSATTDEKSRQNLFDRLFGKVKETVDLNVSADADKMTDEQIFRILTENAHLLTTGSDE